MTEVGNHADIRLAASVCILGVQLTVERDAPARRSPWRWTASRSTNVFYRFSLALSAFSARAASTACTALKGVCCCQRFPPEELFSKRRRRPGSPERSWSATTSRACDGWCRVYSCSALALSVPHGEWHREARRILLSEPIVAKSDTHPAHVACLLVHEISMLGSSIEVANTSWAAGAGSKLSVTGRQARPCAPGFAEAMSFGGYYEVQARQTLSQSDDDWSDAAFRKRAVGNLHILGAPTWLIEIRREVSSQDSKDVA